MPGSDSTGKPKVQGNGVSSAASRSHCGSSDIGIIRPDSRISATRKTSKNAEDLVVQNEVRPSSHRYSARIR
ncbi:hypothetical protein GCM10009634_50180 [Saccharothrix xinjiangensis]